MAEILSAFGLEVWFLGVAALVFTFVLDDDHDELLGFAFFVLGIGAIISVLSLLGEGSWLPMGIAGFVTTIATAAIWTKVSISQ